MKPTIARKADRPLSVGSLADMYDFSVLRELRKRENLNIAEVSERSSISPAVISKLERNQTRAELETLFRLSRVFGMNATDLLALAESRTAHKTKASSHSSNGFRFQEVQYGNVRCLFGSGTAGQKVSRPEIHQDDYEIGWVLQGRVRVSLPNETHELKVGDAIQFDAILSHTYEVLEDCQIIIIQLRKGKRF
jgi:transcriptional regulator with XRE-family HTH domain